MAGAHRPEDDLRPCCRDDPGAARPASAVLPRHGRGHGGGGRAHALHAGEVRDAPLPEGHPAQHVELVRLRHRQRDPRASHRRSCRMACRADERAAEIAHLPHQRHRAGHALRSLHQRLAAAARALGPHQHVVPATQRRDRRSDQRLWHGRHDPHRGSAVVAARVPAAGRDAAQFQSGAGRSRAHVRRDGVGNDPPRHAAAVDAGHPRAVDARLHPHGRGVRSACAGGASGPRPRADDRHLRDDAPHDAARHRLGQRAVADPALHRRRAALLVRAHDAQRGKVRDGHRQELPPQPARSGRHGVRWRVSRSGSTFSCLSSCRRSFSSGRRCCPSTRRSARRRFRFSRSTITAPC